MKKHLREGVARFFSQSNSVRSSSYTPPSWIFQIPGFNEETMKDDEEEVFHLELDHHQQEEGGSISSRQESFICPSPLSCTGERDRSTSSEGRSSSGFPALDWRAAVGMIGSYSPPQGGSCLDLAVFRTQDVMGIGSSQNG